MKILGFVVFYLSVVFFFAFYSVILDEVFFKLDYGESYGLFQSFFYYVIYLLNWKLSHCHTNNCFL
jgi:hypothetical protein